MDKSHTIKQIFTLFALFGIMLFLPTIVKARDASQITDWYIKDFQSEIVVNKDSSLLITERITADCDNLPDKHGIFRILPLYYQETTNKKVSTPIELKSITDFAGQSIPYSTTKNRSDITWKIGDANKTVTGENDYIITYLVKNTIRFDSPSFDEFYWNLNGNFWQIETDKFTGNIKFPSEITEDNTAISAYSGKIGTNSNSLASYKWTDSHTLQFISSKTLKPGEGITASVTFPKSIISPYNPTLTEKYGQYLFFLIPLIIFFLCLNIWRRFGKDFKLNRAIMAEYDIPDKLSPIEFTVLFDNGQLKTQAISAAIIGLAVKGYIKIEQIEKKGLFGKKDFKLIKLDGKNPLSIIDKNLLSYLFGGATEINLNDLENKFYSNITRLKDESIEFLSKGNYVDKAGYGWQIGFFVMAFVSLFGTIFAFTANSFVLATALILSIIIFVIFAILMPKRTKKGAETFWRMQGFKLFISMTEKYRANFDEKENIFEKFLPYAMIFGLTKIWINNMKKIYGESYFNTYHPIWFYGLMFTNFDAKTFDSMITDLSNNMNSVIASNPSSSGAGGGGFAGGGGGGGGGGGW